MQEICRFQKLSEAPSGRPTKLIGSKKIGKIFVILTPWFFQAFASDMGGTDASRTWFVEIDSQLNWFKWSLAFAHI